MVRAMASAPALLRSYLDLSRAMKRSHLDRRVSARIGTLGLSERDIELARQGSAIDSKIAAIVAFGQQVFAAPAEITDEQVRELRDLGYTDEQIAEVPGLVALNVLFNPVAGIHPSTSARSAA